MILLVCVTVVYHNDTHNYYVRCDSNILCQVLSVKMDVPSADKVSVSYRILTPANTFVSHTSRYGLLLQIKCLYFCARSEAFCAFIFVILCICFLVPMQFIDLERLEFEMICYKVI